MRLAAGDHIFASKRQGEPKIDPYRHALPDNLVSDSRQPKNENEGTTDIQSYKSQTS